jgi:hypothetical protein
MATFRKRNSLWQAQVRSRKYGSISKSFHLKSDAQAWARAQESLMQTGQWSKDHNKEISKTRFALRLWNSCDGS